MLKFQRPFFCLWMYLELLDEWQTVYTLIGRRVLRHLKWVFTVCSDLPVQIFLVNTEIWLNRTLQKYWNPESTPEIYPFHSSDCIYPHSLAFLGIYFIAQKPNWNSGSSSKIRVIGQCSALDPFSCWCSSLNTESQGKTFAISLQF